MIHTAIYKINNINKPNYTNNYQINEYSTGLNFKSLSQDSVSFKSQICSEPILKKLEGVVSNIATTSTGFFRDHRTQEAAKSWLGEHFPKGCHIADFACSSGEETKTLSMILGPKYSITGYDIAENAIKKAKSGKHDILIREDYEKYYDTLKYGTDSFLLQEKKDILPELRNYKDLFYQYFDETGETKNFQKLLLNYVDAKHVQEKQGIFDNKVNFQVANIFGIDKIYKNSDPNLGGVFFQNALYHISGNSEPGKSECNFDNLKTLSKKIYKVLPENGIFVCGRYLKDHIYYNPDNLDDFIKPYNDSPLYRILEETGFKPVFHDLCVMTDKSKNIYVPSIWKK